MNTSPQLVRSVVSGALAVRPFPATPRLPIGIQSRTGLPVVSNRAFISSWITRRSRIIAAAQLARKAM
jgi:hypothetical protein